MKSIIFVDDEPNIIQGLKRMFHSMREEWKMYFANSGEEALDILSKNPIDVVVSDMRMPNMDGAELLSRVQEKYPQTVRIILSGHSDEKMILRSTKSTHQFISKPCNADTLKNAIQRAYSLRDLLKNENLVKIVSGIDNLPSLPSLYYKLLDELQSEDSSIKTIGDVIAQDITMSAKVLQFVNSAFFGLPQHISNPHQAVSMLGVNLIKSLIISVGVFTTFKVPPGSGFSLESLWEHSMGVGTLSKKIIQSEISDIKKSEDAMISGLLHDIGKLLIIRLEGYSKKVNNILDEKNCLLHEAEREAFGASHAEVGAYLLSLWGIPDPIIETVAFHHEPSKLKEINFSILTAVHIANAFYSNKDQTMDITESPYLDTGYLKNVKCEKKLIKYKELFLEITKKGNYV